MRANSPSLRCHAQDSRGQRIVVEDVEVEVAAYEAAGARGSTKDGGAKEKTVTHQGSHRGRRSMVMMQSRPLWQGVRRVCQAW